MKRTQVIRANRTLDIKRRGNPLGTDTGTPPGLSSTLIGNKLVNVFGARPGCNRGLPCLGLSHVSHDVNIGPSVQSAQARMGPTTYSGLSW